MDKNCCNIKVTETQKGYCFEITGKEIKDKCKAFVEKCCAGGKPWEEFIKKCCSSKG